MSRSAILATIACLAVVAALAWLVISAHEPAQPHFNASTSAAAASPASPAATSSTGQCHEHNGLPDPQCTPGATSRDVTQATIGSTICVSGYTSGGTRSDGRSVRPPTSYTEPLKVSGIAAYGYADTNVADYEEDHLIPLELGGDGWSSANLWPEPRVGPTGSLRKDQVENELHRLVCSGAVTLAAAQRAIATDWETALALT